MKAVYTSTALALLLGLGVTGASLPANAAGEIVVAQAGGAAGGGQGGGESGAVHPLEVTGAEAEGALECDPDEDGFVNIDEARACYEEHFGVISGGGSELTLEQFDEDMAEAEDPEGLRAEIDTDGDGIISREEYIAWREQSFAEAAPEGRMAVEDYDRWWRSGTVD